MTVRVALFGLGRMGAGYESVGGVPRNHLAAILANPKLKLLAAIDPDSDMCALAAQRFPAAKNVVAGSFAPQLVGGIDLAVVATPPDARDLPVAASLAAGAQLLILEKPLAPSLESARDISSRIDGASATLRVNFHRRFDPGMQELKSVGGPVLAAQARYGKGLSNYGSHLIDLLMEWCGPPVAVQALGVAQPGGDPTVSFRLTFATETTCLVLGLAETSYDCFDVDLYLADRRIEIASGGAERRVWRAATGLHYPGYAHLALDAASSSTSALGGLTELYHAAVAHFDEGVAMPGCTAADALIGLEVIDALMRSSNLGGALITLSNDVRSTRHALQ